MRGFKCLQYLLCKILKLPLSRFVDDLFAIVPADGAQQCVDWMLEVVSLLGFCLAPDKTPPPNVRQVVLGVELEYKFCERREKVSYSIRVRLDPLKAAFWRELLSESMRTGILSKKKAQKMAGRLGFVAYAILGPIGASHVNHLYAVRCG